MTSLIYSVVKKNCFIYCNLLVKYRRCIKERFYTKHIFSSKDKTQKQWLLKLPFIMAWKYDHRKMY